MNKSSNVETISEGLTDLLVFKKNKSTRGPGVKDKLPFYNPAMELNRDLSILVCQWLVNNSSKSIHFLDGLAASGARGIRIKNEISGDFSVSINDWDEKAYDLIKKNVKHCDRVNDVTVENKNLNVLLSEKKFDYIDVDPFGSPAYFIDSAVRSIRHNGIIACTATDTAALCGVYPRVCKRRYAASPFHCVFMKEIGLRILVGFICRQAAKYDKGIKPLVCYITDHYFRVYILVTNNVTSANSSIKNMSIVNSDDFVFCKKPDVNVGPLWTGKLQDKKTVENLRTILFEKQLNTKNNIWKMLDLLEEEADAPCFFYTSDDVASKLKVSPPSMKTFFEKLKKQGYIVTRTHFSPTGFKTNASKKIIEETFKHDSDKL